MTRHVTAFPVRNIGGFLTGASYPLRAARFILSHPSLWPYCIVPLIINVVVVVCVWIWSGVILNEWFQHHFLGTGWFWSVVRGLAEFLAVVVRIVISLAAFVVAGSVASLPFNDTLSERTDILVTGWKNDRTISWPRKLSELLITFGQELKRLAVFAMISILLFLLSWIPLFTPFTTAAQLFLASFFFAMDYLSFPLERRGLLLVRDKKTFIQQNNIVCLGFGASMTAIALIPLVNFLFLPLGVVGGTLLHSTLLQSGSMKPAPARSGHGT